VEDVKLWCHTVRQIVLAARPECKMVNDPALLLAPKRPINLSEDADIIKVKLVTPVCGRSWAMIPGSTHITHSSKRVSSFFFAPSFSRLCQQTTWLNGTFSESVNF